MQDETELSRSDIRMTQARTGNVALVDGRSKGLFNDRQASTPVLEDCVRKYGIPDDVCAIVIEEILVFQFNDDSMDNTSGSRAR